MCGIAARSGGAGVGDIDRETGGVLMTYTAWKWPPSEVASDLTRRI